MDSMTNGRCAAMAAHASSIMTVFFESGFAPFALAEKYREWKTEAANFGTVYVLQTNNPANTLWAIENLKRRFDQLYCGIVVDPDYRVVDGEISHSIKVETAYVLFGPKSEIMKELFAHKHEMYR